MLGMANFSHFPGLCDWPYLLTIQKLHEQWRITQELTGKRRKELEEEKERQIASDQVRKQFIQLATELNTWLELTQGRLNNVGLGDASLEEQVKVLTTLDAELETQRPKLIELEDFHQVVFISFVSQSTFILETCLYRESFIATARCIWGSRSSRLDGNVAFRVEPTINGFEIH